MEKQFLLPHKYKKVGWICMGISFLLWGLSLFYDGNLPWSNVNIFTFINKEPLGETIFLGFSEVDLGFTLIGILFIIGGLVVAFSGEKREDEYIMQLRLSSFQWAVFLNYTILLLAFILIFGTDFLSVLVYNMFTTLLFFIIRFHYLLKTLNQ